MTDDRTKKARLSHLELAAIDFSITVLQASGHTLGDRAKSDNPREQAADGWVDVHHPLVELNEHDREIIRQIKSLASQLQSRISLAQLIEARGKLLQGQSE